MAEKNGKTKRVWELVFDEDDQDEPPVVERAPETLEECFSLAAAMDAAGVQSVVVERGWDPFGDDYEWFVEDWGASPRWPGFCHPLREEVATGYMGGNYPLDRNWALVRIGDHWFEVIDTGDETELGRHERVEDAVAASWSFRLTPTGDIVLTELGHDELLDFLSAHGRVIRDSEELGVLTQIPFSLVAAMAHGKKLANQDDDEEAVDYDDEDILNELEEEAFQLVAAGATEGEARLIMLSGCRSDPVRVLGFIRSLGPNADALGDSVHDVHDLITWVEDRAAETGKTIAEAFDDAPTFSPLPRDAEQ